MYSPEVSINSVFCLFSEPWVSMRTLPIDNIDKKLYGKLQKKKPASLPVPIRMFMYNSYFPISNKAFAGVFASTPPTAAARTAPAVNWMIFAGISARGTIKLLYITLSAI